ncbi:hypothetical protein BJY01DRAFT_202574 [Aspergillus pseudoustus]|uniref:Uncharacterized protein n=1 Tax=Aspergillus pseudoustus TaxID=1810923 RepID=A0ABR4KYE8_9EURO
MLTEVSFQSPSRIGTHWLASNLIILVVALPSLVGSMRLHVLPQSSTGARKTGMWLLLRILASYALMLSLIASNVAGTTKKLTATLLSSVILCVGNIVGLV